MKRILILLLAGLLVLSGCGKNIVEDKKEEKLETKTEAKENKEVAEEKPSEVAKSIDDMTEAELEEAWKSEEAYGKLIQIGFNGGLCTGGAGIAHALGYFKDEGLDVELVKMQGGIDALGTAKVDMSCNHIAELLVPAVNGVDMVFKKGTQTGCKSLYVLKDGPINKVTDLVGKAIGLPNGIGGSDHNIALRFINRDNIDPKDIKWKPVESSAVILAMQNGEVDGAILSDQFAEKFIQDGTLKMIRSLTYDDDFKHEPCCVYVFNKTFAQNNPVTVKKMTKALFRVSDFIAHNTKEATQILFDNSWASGDFDQAVRMMESYDWQVSNDETAYTLTRIIDDYKKFGVLTSDKSVDEILDMVWEPEAYKHDNEDGYQASNK